MEKNNYTVGLDIGITSCGFAIINPNPENARLVEMGVRHFKDATPAKDNRVVRGARRLKDRKKWRSKQLVDAFVEFGIVSREDVNKNGYKNFTYRNESISKPQDETVYHLRKRALNEQVSERELFLTGILTMFLSYNHIMAFRCFMWVR